MSAVPEEDREDEAEESQWRFTLEEVGEDAAPSPDPIEPGSPSLENAAFVLLGVVLSVAIFYATVGAL
jgi:hypothetical protein